MSRRRVPRPVQPAGEVPDDTGCTVLHVDMDAFFASVELLRHPHLRGRPVIVGGGRRGVVLSATYEARRAGVHAAMPMGRARRLCPQAVVLPPHHEDYARVSAGVMAVFRSTTERVEPLSLDEAFLDVAAARRRLGGPTAIARLLRDRIADEQGITCSVGVAATKFVAKLASAAAKPDGLLVVPRARTVEFLHELPVAALWGVGERTEETLLRLGLRTVADIAHTPVETLRRALGEATGRSLHELSWGRDPRPVHAEREERSVGAEQTFARDVDDPRLVHREILRLAERTAGRMRAAGLAGRTVVLKVRFADFTTLTRSRTLPEPTDVTRVVHATAHGLYEALGLQRARIRLVGVRVEGLVPASAQHRQLVLGERPQGWREADEAVDRVSARFGRGAVRPASLLPPPGAEGGDPWAAAAPR
ncbi:DNA polymerase-4 [Kineococcus xinjiangensis]|uniref:DNA polymerase IV n=1 Tax=Kineococcus xinjiangensis TaxID=512762 RepID=A0A2S6IM04_9ACTN|nr:DNA polymerase IV [Kineococcus xinjiangensis]PPK95249.1 DNA polymerase-4 [Kineococcus xinjiangensis]